MPTISAGVYGARKLHAELRKKDKDPARCTVSCKLDAADPAHRIGGGMRR